MAACLRAGARARVCDARREPFLPAQHFVFLHGEQVPSTSLLTLPFSVYLRCVVPHGWFIDSVDNCSRWHTSIAFTLLPWNRSVWPHHRNA